MLNLVLMDTLFRQWLLHCMISLQILCFGLKQSILVLSNMMVYFCYLLYNQVQLYYDLYQVTMIYE
nr:MAG TPA: hypothetical protein [Crassvirales sp.]